MKKRWLSLAVALLMAFALIAQGLTPVLAEVEVEIGQAEDALKLEDNLSIDGDEAGLSFGNDFPADQIDGGLAVELEDLSLS